MKKIIFTLLVTTVLFSCKTNYNFYNQDIDYKKIENSPYTLNMVKKMQSSDAQYIKENWSEAEKKDFLENYVYKDIRFSNDTLVIIK